MVQVLLFISTWFMCMLKCAQGVWYFPVNGDLSFLIIVSLLLLSTFLNTGLVLSSQHRFVIDNSRFGQSTITLHCMSGYTFFK